MIWTNCSKQSLMMLKMLRMKLKILKNMPAIVSVFLTIAPFVRMEPINLRQSLFCLASHIKFRLGLLLSKLLPDPTFQIGIRSEWFLLEFNFITLFNVNTYFLVLFILSNVGFCAGFARVDPL